MAKVKISRKENKFFCAYLREKWLYLHQINTKLSSSHSIHIVK